jgi:hypothetical protein
MPDRSESLNEFTDSCIPINVNDFVNATQTNKVGVYIFVRKWATAFQWGPKAGSPKAVAGGDG